MAQVTSQTVANGSGASVRAAMNQIFGALFSASSGATAPITTVAGQFWFDTNASPAVLKQRNAANDGWVTILDKDAADLLYQGLNANLTSLAGLTLAAGDLLYATGADTLVKLAKGTAGQALVMNSGATAPEWGSAGALETISVTDLSGDPQSDHTLSSAYALHIFDFINIIPASDSRIFGMRTSTDGGSSFATGASAYSWEGFYQGGSNPVSVADSADDRIQLSLDRNLGSAANEYGFFGRIYVASHADAASYTRVIGHGETIGTATDFRNLNMAGARTSTAVVDAVRFLMDVGNMESGKIIHSAIRGS